jgi:hypothetical protein
MHMFHSLKVPAALSQPLPQRPPAQGCRGFGENIYVENRMISFPFQFHPLCGHFQELSGILCQCRAVFAK